MSEQLAEPVTLQFSRSRKARPGTTDPGKRARTLSSTAKSRLSVRLRASASHKRRLQIVCASHFRPAPAHQP
jgi:hypothetical protein